MLTIRTDQLRALRAALMPALAARVAEYLRANHAALVADIPDADLLSRILYSVSRAQEHGLTWESSLFTFAVLSFQIGPEFDTQLNIQAALREARLSVLGDATPDERFRSILRRATEADWQEARALGVSLTSDPFSLAPISRAEVAALADLLRKLEPDPPLPVLDLERWVARSLSERAAGCEFAFVVRAQAGAVAGLCTLHDVDDVAGRARLGYWIGRPHRNRGYATGAVQRVAAFGFSRLALAQIEAAVAPENAASRRVLEKLGARALPDGRGATRYCLLKKSRRGGG
jgi:RimJ/RimL family protein N-acetyltransferase